MQHKCKMIKNLTKDYFWNTVYIDSVGLSVWPLYEQPSLFNMELLLSFHNFISVTLILF